MPVAYLLLTPLGLFTLDSSSWETRGHRARPATGAPVDMIVAAHQPHYLPWLGYLDKIAKADLFVVMDDLQYEAQNFQNRQRVKLNDGAGVADGAARARRAGRSRSATSASTTAASREAALAAPPLAARSRSHYRRAPYFARYADELREVYTRPGTRLVELDLHMLELARALVRHHAADRARVVAGAAGQKTDRSSTVHEGRRARVLSGGGGSTGYLDVEQLGRAGVGVIWQQFEHPRYPQRYPSSASSRTSASSICCSTAARRAATILFEPCAPRCAGGAHEPHPRRERRSRARVRRAPR